ncbi:hypothetical protein BDW02DRAFT_416520 [Decorospora gaudefroyi]|uniref:Uncharacterized protein n=1 Tax=Decorospora gaudefroyi TaxID=184978 RepID=A0A6A5KBT8_9PLEO|nr:hypothetical protein BDW02DRAFT_416520 [Decorospora gaudefroyi]
MSKTHTTGNPHVVSWPRSDISLVLTRKSQNGHPSKLISVSIIYWRTVFLLFLFATNVINYNAPVFIVPSPLAKLRR